MSKIQSETPYIRRLYLDDKNHLIASMSDGNIQDVGYMPTRGIRIYYKDNKDDDSV